MNTEKTEKPKLLKKEKVHYFNHRPMKKKGNSNLHPFTLMLQWVI